MMIMAEANVARRKFVDTPASVTTMANRFKGYGPMTESEVWPLAVSGDTLSHLREKRKMLNDMTPEQALDVIEFHDNLTVFQALKLAQTQNKLIVPNDVMDRILNETDKRYLGWTGTMVIYEATNKPFGDKVVYNWEAGLVNHSIRFDVPQQFRGKTNCVLVVEHPDFEFAPLGNNCFELKAAEGTVSLLEPFPKNSGWYGHDERFRIPVGSPKEANNSTRHLWRRGGWRRDGGHVGLVARDYRSRNDCSSRRSVDLDNAPSNAFGVALF